MARTMKVNKRTKKVEVKATDDLNVARNIKNVMMVHVVNCNSEISA